jgi:hypothetical protein
MMCSWGALGSIARGARRVCGVGVDIWWLGWRKLVGGYMDISSLPPHRSGSRSLAANEGDASLGASIRD